MNDGSSFENEVRYLLGLQGWRVRSEVLLGHKKVDGYADKISDLGYRERVVVECKDYSARLSQDVVTHRDAATRRVVHERRRPKIGFFVPLTKIHRRYVPGYDQATGRFECRRRL